MTTKTTKENWELTTEEIKERVALAAKARDGFTPLEMRARLVEAGKKDERNWEHDAWEVTLSRGCQSMTFPYFTGTGHRRVPQNSGAKWTTIERSRLPKKGETPVPCVPSLYDVLSCVMSDGAAASQNFLDWCDDFGYDTDSRKALDMYEACVRVGRDARRVLGDLYAQFDGAGF